MGVTIEYKGASKGLNVLAKRQYKGGCERISRPAPARPLPFLYLRQARRPKVVPKPRAPSSRELGETTTQVPHGGASPRKSSRILSKSEHALVCLVWALPCQVLSPCPSAMMQNWPSVCMVSRNAQITQVTHGMHLDSLYLVLPWSHLGENPNPFTLTPHPQTLKNPKANNRITFCAGESHML